MRKATNVSAHLLEEQTVFACDAPKCLPRHFARNPVHIATLMRWIHRGVRGVRLEAVRLGGRWVTSREALARFVDRITVASRPSEVTVESRATVRRRAERAAHQLENEGI